MEYIHQGVTYVDPQYKHTLLITFIQDASMITVKVVRQIVKAGVDI